MPGSKKSKGPNVPGLRTEAGTQKYRTLVNRMFNIARVKQIPTEHVNAVLKVAYDSIKQSSNEELTGRQLLRNINDNEGSFTDLNSLLFNQKTAVSVSSKKSKTATKPSTFKEEKEAIASVLQKEAVASSSKEPATMEEQQLEPLEFYMHQSYLPASEESQSSEFKMQVDQEEAKEPKLSQAQMQHIKEVVKILEKNPALKNDIKRTITEELTKGSIQTI